MIDETATREIAFLNGKIADARLNSYSLGYDVMMTSVFDEDYPKVYQAFVDSESILNTLRGELAAAKLKATAQAAQAEAVVEIEADIETAEENYYDLKRDLDHTRPNEDGYEELYKEFEEAGETLAFLRIDLQKSQELDLS